VTILTFFFGDGAGDLCRVGIRKKIPDVQHKWLHPQSCLSYLSTAPILSKNSPRCYAERNSIKEKKMDNSGMPPPGRVQSWFSTLLGYHKYSGAWAWILHRLTGIGLTGYIIMHIFALSTLQRGKEPFDAEMALFQTPVFLFFEWLLGALVFYHALNGIRIVLVDLANGSRYHKALYYAAWCVGIILMIAMAILIFGPHLTQMHHTEG
jgi:succinate dehydrogenase / fumarate reductase cytochrome b subunit